MQSDDSGRAGQRRAAACLVASGVAGLLALASLIAALVGRANYADEAAQRGGIIVTGFWDALFRGHDVAGIAQALLMIAPVYALAARVDSGGRLSASALARLGATAFGLLALCLALIFITRASDMLYMLPQGIAGAWLLMLNRRHPAGFGKALRVFGIVSGAGLFVVGISAIGVGAALGPGMLAIVGPIPTRVDAAAEQGTLNIVSHVFMMAGTLAGVLTFPAWCILAGRSLRRAHQ